MDGHPVYTPSMLASALQRFSESDRWVRVRARSKTHPSKTMFQVVLFESSKKDKDGRPLTHRTTEQDCTCEGFTYHRGVCAHWLALQLDIQQARRKAERRPRQNDHPANADVF